MKNLLESLTRLEQQLASERGLFWLFALLLPEDAAGQWWDLVVAAPWLGSEPDDGLDFIARQVQAELDVESVMQISKVVVIKQDNPGLRSIASDGPVEHGLVEVRDRTFFGIPMRRGYIITARPPALPAAAAR